MSCKNILMIIPNLGFGGAQRSFNNLANSLSPKHKVFICVFNMSERVDYKYQPEIIDLNIPGGGNFFSKPYRFYQRYAAIRKLKKRLNIDTTISYLEGANYLNVLTKGKDRIVLSVRGSKIHDPNIRGIIGYLRKQILIPIMYKHADYIVALNLGIEKELVRNFNINEDKVRVIRNFYDAPAIEAYAVQPINQRYAQLLKEQYIIYSGRLATEKGIKSIIDTFKVLLSRISRLQLVLVGDGPIKEDLIAYCKSQGLRVFSGAVTEENLSGSEQVIFLGYQANPYNFLKRATVLIIGSIAEGGPNILTESMICGTLVAATDCPYGPREQLAPKSAIQTLEKAYEGDYGILLPMINRNPYEPTIKEWARSIEEFIRAPEKRDQIVNRAKRHILAQSPKEILGQWEKII